MSLFRDIRDLAGRSAVYGLGSIVARSITFFLLPLYTRYLTPAEYGIVAVSGTISVVLGLMLPLGLHGAVAKYHVATADPRERRRSNGTLWLSVVVGALVLSLLLDRFGSPAFAWLVPQVPFAPYIRLAIWTAFFGVFGLVPLAIMQMEERPLAYVAGTLASGLASAALVVWFVVVRHDGAQGYLMGVCAGAAISALGYSIWGLRRLAPIIDPRILGRALVFALPLVPHGLAGWVLDASDRVLLERFVPAAAIGLYALGFQFGAIANMVASAANSAWVPFVYKRVASTDGEPRLGLARLATMFTVVMCGVGLGLALLGRDAVEALMAPAYRGAGPVIPWIVGGYVFAGLYFVPTSFLFVAERTGIIPIVTVTAGAANVLLNLWLMPRYGMIAAAWTTLATYLATLVFAWAAAQRVYPVPYEYGRIARVAAVALALFAVGAAIGHGTVVASAAHLMALASFFALLPVIGIVSSEERARARVMARGLLRTRR